MNTNFADVRMLNQDIWDKYPERAKERALQAIHTGGFDEDCIGRRVGNYEGQIMAIRFGWVDKEKHRWRINNAGMAALREAGETVPVFLPALDTWHRSPYEYCAYEKNGRLKLFTDAVPCGANWGMKPELRRGDVVKLRDYLNDWLSRNPE